MESLVDFGIIPVEYATILNHFSEYKSPKDKISRDEQSGKLIRLKKGLYIVSPILSKKTISVELIANHLYGPSYISFETALSYKGIIPERTYIVKSVTTKRKRNYHTPFGDFEYIRVPDNYYSVGLEQLIIQDVFAFIMASPEKALCDLIITTSGLRFQSKKSILEYLLEDLRIEMEDVVRLDPKIIEKCGLYGYKKKEISLLNQVVIELINKNKNG